MIYTNVTNERTLQCFRNIMYNLCLIWASNILKDKQRYAVPAFILFFAKRRNYHILTLKIKVKHLYFSSRRRENGHFSFGLFPDFFAVPKYNALGKKNYHENRQYYI